MKWMPPALSHAICFLRGHDWGPKFLERRLCRRCDRYEVFDDNRWQLLSFAFAERIRQARAPVDRSADKSGLVDASIVSPGGEPMVVPLEPPAREPA